MKAIFSGKKKGYFFCVSRQDGYIDFEVKFGETSMSLPLIDEDVEIMPKTIELMLTKKAN